MKRFLPLAFDVIAALAAAVWLGGVALLWLIVIPTIATPTPIGTAVTTHSIPLLELRFSAAAEACGLILAALQWLLRRRYERDRRLYVVDGTRMLVLFAALLASEIGRYGILPTAMKAGTLPGAGAMTGLAVAQAILLIGYAALTRWLQLGGVPVDKPVRTK